MHTLRLAIIIRIEALVPDLVLVLDLVLGRRFIPRVVSIIPALTAASCLLTGRIDRYGRRRAI